MQLMTVGPYVRVGEGHVKCCFTTPTPGNKGKRNQVKWPQKTQGIKETKKTRTQEQKVINSQGHNETMTQEHMNTRPQRHK